MTFVYQPTLGLCSMAVMTPDQTLEQLTAQTFKQVLRIPDPEIRLRALATLFGKLDGAVDLARQERMNLAVELRLQGVTWRRLSELTDLSVTYLQKRVPIEIELRATA